jgi:tetratricopeptide (TPR) repeat protein
VAEAAEHYKQAGDQAVTRLAYREAHGYFAQALELLGALPENAGRHAKEIDLLMAQAAPLGALRGYEDPEFLASIARTERLCEAVGPGPQQIPGLLRLMLLHTNQLPRARAYAHALLAVVEPLGIGPLRVAGYMIRGTGSLTSATISEACADLKQALEIAQTTELQTPKAAFEIDSVAMGCCTYAIALVMSGKPDTATQLIERGLERARMIGHPRTLASALQNAAMAFYMMDDAAASGELSDQCLELIEGRGFHHVEASARVLGGWARACRGDRAAIDGMDAALRSADEHGVLSGMAKLHFTSAEAHARVGSYARAVEQLKRGEAFSGRAGEQFRWEPDALLTRARIMMLEAAGEDSDEIESLLLRSHQLWQRNQSPWYSILTATLLGRVALETGTRRAEAHERLSRLYAGFSEGFESRPMRGAQDMLDRLASA